jgi:hypothetical protein
MATFIILPPRELIEHAVTEFAERLMPGFVVPHGLWEQIIDTMIGGFQTTAESMVFVLHREDLSDGSVLESLTTGYGAMADDHVIEIDSPRSVGPGRARKWIINPAPQSTKSL